MSFIGGKDEKSRREGHLPAPIRGREKGEMIGIMEAKGDIEELRK